MSQTDPTPSLKLGRPLPDRDFEPPLGGLVKLGHGKMRFLDTKAFA
jgi:hypothetical protein